MTLMASCTLPAVSIVGSAGRFDSGSGFPWWRRRKSHLGNRFRCLAGPLVRSSYKAGEFFLTNVLNKRRGVAPASASEAAPAAL